MTPNDALRKELAILLASFYKELYPALTLKCIQEHCEHILQTLETGLETHIILDTTGALNENILYYKVVLP